MPNDIHDKWMQEALGVKIGYPRPVPDDEDRPQKGKVEFGPPEIERPLGEPVYGPKADTLYAFLNDKGGLIDSSFAPTAVKLNEEGAAVQALFRAISKRQIEWNNKIGGIQKNAGKGKDELKQLQNAAAAIGDHARGPEGQYMREAIEAYRDAVKKAAGQVGEIGLKMKAYEIATADLGVQKLEGKVVVADRNVKEGEETVRVEEKRVEEEKKKIEKFFEISVHMFEPHNWTGFARAAVACVSEQMLEDNLVSTKHLDELRKELAEAKEKLASLQDMTQLAKMAVAAEKMSLASDEVAKAREDFAKFSEDVQLKETTVIEAMKRSKSTSTAADVIAKRAAITKAAAEAEVLMKQYLKDTGPFVKRMKNLADRYRGYQSIAVQHEEGKSFNVPYRMVLSDLAKRNAETTNEFVQWVEDMRALAQQDLAYLANRGDETYFAGYNEIPDVLQAALAGRLGKK